MPSKLGPVPDIDLEELEQFRKRNREERLKFVRWYAEWVKTHSNKEWSQQQKELIDGQFDD
jgi:hypothetical protein